MAEFYEGRIPPNLSPCDQLDAILEIARRAKRKATSQHLLTDKTILEDGIDQILRVIMEGAEE